MVFAIVGVCLTVLVSLLTGDVVLGVLYGVLPGSLLGSLAWYRISRGGLLKRASNRDRPGPF